MKTSAWVLSCVCSLSFLACNPGGGGGNTGGGTGSTCTTPTGSGTQHSSAPTTSETWTAAGSPHVVTTSLNIYDGVTLTVEPCAVVELGGGAHLAFGDSIDSARLVARGTATQPIVFKPVDTGAPWASLAFSKNATGELAYVTLEGGASQATSLNYPAVLMLEGDDNQNAPLRQVKLDNVLIKDSANDGVELIAAAGFTADSHDLTVTGAQGFAVRGEPLSIQTLPSGAYTGNGKDVVQTAIRGSVQGDLHLKNYGVPFVLEDSLQLLAPAGTVITFTLDPGVTIKIPAADGISLDDTGSVNHGSVKVLANGTDTNPIRFTSTAATPAAGDWSIVDWESGTADSSLNHVVFEYGGGFNGHNGFGCGNGTNQGLLIIHDWVPPAGLVQNSTFRNSSGGGIVSGWTDDPAQLPNLAANNTFEGIHVNHCKVSKPQGASECSAVNAPGDCYL